VDFPVDTSTKVGELLRSTASAPAVEECDALDSLEREEGAQPSADPTDFFPSTDSIFSQVIGQIVQGHRINLGDSSDGALSLEILLENSKDAVLLLETEGVITEANPVFCSTYGYTRADLVGSSIFSLVHESEHDLLLDKLRQFASNEADDRPARADDVIVFHGLTKNRAILTKNCLVSPLYEGKKRRILAIFRDRFLDEERFEELQLKEEHYLALAETINEAIFRLDENFMILFANAGVKNVFGFDKEELVGQPFTRLFPEEVFRHHEPEFRKYFHIDDQDRSSLGLRRTIELLGVTKNRGVAPMEMSFGNSKELRGRTLTCIIRDISQRKTLERKLHHLAFHDKLTGLGNRDLLNEDLRSLLQPEAVERGELAAIVLLDVSDFKHINDTLGHTIGDEILVELARRTRFSLREKDTAYRYSGDKFVALLRSVKHQQDPTLVASRLLDSIRMPIELRINTGARRRIELGASIGIAVLPEHGLTVESLVKNAEIAMYFAKESGKNRFIIYNESLKPKSTERWLLEQEMRDAVVRGEFVLHYQPIVDPEGKILGCEALVRWMRDGAIVMPSSIFIPVAEENGVILAIGAWILRRALIDLKHLSGRGYRGIYFSINVSTRQFEQPDFVKSVADAIDDAGVDTRLVNLELTETTLMSHPEDAILKIHALKRRYPGIRVTIDDFGTGYSSLSYLARLPIDCLKVDISFVRALDSEQNRKVVNAILNLADTLRIGAIIEGIDSKEHYNYFKTRDCYGMQGFLFMKAVPLDDFESKLDAIRLAAKAFQGKPPSP
jgi:diguanylate cyclase (GGDEF)-like protein/PAS domain S-box-containing protein